MSKASQDEKLGGLVNRYKFATIGEKYAAARFRPTGFDYLRIILAVSILLWHAILVAHEESWSRVVVESPWKVPLLFIVPSFFALSGFLIASSLERSTIPVFIGLRILRIIPALTVDTLITVLLVGPLFTILSLRQYFFSKETWKYLLNIAGHIHYRLPGVFLHNPLPAIINAQLWTIPWEFVCYFSIVVLALAGIARSRAAFLVVAVIGPIVVMAILATIYPARFGLNPQIIAPNSIDIVLCFLVGVAIYQYRELIPHSPMLALLAVVAYILLMLTQYASVFSSLFVAYLTVWVGVTNFRKTFLIRGSDYSYGIYLYHMTVQQAIAALGIVTWYAVFGMSLSLVLMIAALSWRFVEKPSLSLRKYLTGKPKLQQAQQPALPQQELKADGPPITQSSSISAST